MDASITRSRREACCTAELFSLWLNCKSADIAVAPSDTEFREVALLT